MSAIQPDLYYQPRIGLTSRFSTVVDALRHGDLMQGFGGRGSACTLMFQNTIEAATRLQALLINQSQRGIHHVCLSQSKNHSVEVLEDLLASLYHLHKRSHSALNPSAHALFFASNDLGSFHSIALGSSLERKVTVFIDMTEGFVSLLVQSDRLQSINFVLYCRLSQSLLLGLIVYRKPTEITSDFFVGSWKICENG